MVFIAIMRALKTPSLLCSLILSLALILHPSVASAKTKCGGYRMTLDGMKMEGGVGGREHVVFEKVVKSGGVNGLWKLVHYTLENTYSGPIPFNVAVAERVDLRLGFWIDVVGSVQGNRIIAQSTNSNVVLEVKGNRIGYSKTGVRCGRIQGNQAFFKWDVTDPRMLQLTGPVVLSGEQEIQVDITAPGANERLAFNDDTPGQLEFVAKAQATPASYNDQISWEVQGIEGSQVTIEPQSARGSQVTIRYKGLPEENAEFGPKKIIAKLDVEGCVADDSRTVRVFYPATAKNNPEKKYPNWFYYWKQTPAAKPSGQTIELEWGGRFEDACTHCECPMIYKPLYKGGVAGHKMITVCDLATICTYSQGVKTTTPFTLEFPLLRRQGHGAGTVGKFDGWRKVKHIDLFASGLIHEYNHMVYDMAWRAGKSNAQIAAEDQDQDGIPDSLEEDMGFDPSKQQTFFANDPVLKAIQYDEEWLAYESQNSYQNGIYDAYDWAKPGKQWPD